MTEPATSLATPEQARLTQLEAVVEQGLATFVAVGLALAEIRDEKLYLETHRTFESYLSDRWGMSRSRGYQLMDAAAVSTVVDKAGLPVPANEAQARQLVAVFRDHDEQGLFEYIREKQVAPRDAKRWIRTGERKAERAQARAERFATAPGTVEDGAITIRHCDFRDLLPSLAQQADAIITDPPYKRTWLKNDADDFARLAAHALKPNGTLVVMFGQKGHYKLKQILDTHLAYRWTAIYLMPGSRGLMYSPRVHTSWKPLLIYRRHDAPDEPEILLDDVFVSEAADKQHHHWGQSESGTAALVNAFSHPGDHVIDPFLGGGTTAVVCKRLNRSFTGSDADPAAINTAIERLAALPSAAATESGNAAREGSTP